ncbi:MAG: MSHA biogenesis protein MshP [Gammaproteobacteria bacterium]|jgi:MSHA biogenesis protein MshP
MKISVLRPARQSGFTLITAIFLLVVVALLSGYIISLRSVQQQTLVYGVQGARAMPAARAGIEWGIFESINNNNCTTENPVFQAAGAAISRFDIEVGCTSSSHTEGAAPAILVYQLTSTATTGSYGTLDYVSRRLQATVSRQPP